MFSNHRRRPLFATLLTFVLIGSLFGMATPSKAGTTIITVNNNGDSSTCTSTITLRCAIVTANANNTTPTTINFNLSGSTTITVASVLTITNTSQPITIDGSGQSISVDGGHATQIFAVNSGVTVTLNLLTIEHGNVGTNGGGVLNDGTLMLTNCTFASNTANQGGGVYNDGGTATITNSTFAGNVAYNGGGVLNSATMTISNSTFASNAAYAAYSAGGGVDNVSTLTISNSTLVGNAGAYGAGLYAEGTQNLFSTLIAGNIGSDPDVYGTAVSLGDNLIGDGTGTVGLTNGTNGDQVGTSGAPINPKLGALASNGGSTQTMALLTSSPAIGKGNCAGNTTVTPAAPVVTTDQRGFKRKLLCDVGAFETQPIDTIGVFQAGTFSLRLHNAVGPADLSAVFNPATTPFPIVGDWIGQGYDSIGVYDQSNGVYYLRNTITSGAYNETLVFGNPNDTPLSGRWTAGAAHDGVGVYRPTNGILYAKNALTTGFNDFSLVLGNPGDQGVAGDWTGIGQDGLGVFRPGNLNFYLVNRVLGNGVVYSDENFQFGGSTDLAITGDWIGQGHDGVGTFRPSNATMYLKNALTAGSADNSFVYGASGNQPIAGHWQVIYPPIAPKPLITAKTPTPIAPAGGSVPGGNQIGG